MAGEAEQLPEPVVRASISSVRPAVRRTAASLFLLPLPWLLILVQLLFGLAAEGSDGPAFHENESSGAAPSAYLHRSWQFEDGLPHNTVNAVTQTRDGYLWVGTLEGLARFDGYQFTVFRPEDTPGLKSATIRGLLETQDGSLWIATDEGLSRFRDGNFFHYSTDDGLAGPLVRELHEMADGALWIGTVNGLSIYQNGRFMESPHRAFGGVIRGITQNSDGTIWVAAAHGLYSVKEGKVVSYGKGGADVPGPFDLFRTLTTDSNQAVWAGSLVGLGRFEDGGFTVFGRDEGLNHDVVNTVFEDSRGTIWVGTYGGLSRLEDGRLLDEPDGSGYAYDLVLAITEDREGNLWIGSHEGLSQLRPRSFMTVATREGLRNNNITGVLEDREGRVWASSWGGGVQAINEGETRIGPSRGTPLEKNLERVIENGYALSILETRNRGMWIGMDRDEGIYRFQDGELIHYTGEHGLQPPAVRVIYEDRNENIWVGTNRGLHRYQEGRFTLMTTADGLSVWPVSVIAEDQEGDLWFGSGGGLSRFDGDSFTTFTTADGLPTDTILFLHPDNEGNLWLGTGDAGLVRFRDNRFTTYGVSDGLFIDRIVSIEGDDFGNLWMGSQFGIFRVNKGDLDALDRGEIESVVSTSYGAHDGLLSIQCNGVGKPAVARTQDGRIWFATAKGVAVVDPAEVLAREPRTPPVKIERLIHGEETVEPSENSLLSLSQRHVEVHYTALAFDGPEKNRFQFKLEGFDADWVDAGHRRVAYYSNLSPGRYTFRVKGASSQGVWNEEGASISFEVKPRFYEAGWFLLACLLLLAGALFGAYRLRLRQLVEREVLLANQVDTRTRELQAEILERQRAEEALQKSQEQAVRRERLAVVGQLSAGMAHEFNNLLTVVQGHSSFLLTDPAIPEVAIGSLQAISESSDRGAKLIKQMLAFSRKQIMRKTTIDLNSIIEKLPGMLSRVLGEATVLTCRCGDGLPHVELDAGAIEQCLINFALNARDAMPNGGALTIATESLEIDENNVTNYPDGRLGAFVCLSVTDTGFGMKPEILPRIFEPFFTTKGVGEGSGLGLASVYGLIQQHNGWIDVSSSVGRGTTFRVFFPASRQSIAPGGATAKPIGDSPGGTKTILLVEDESNVRQLASLVLERAGYTVLGAGCGPEALAIYLNSTDQIDLLFTDIVMPGGISGVDLASQLRAVSPELAVVMTSGYSNEIERCRTLAERSAFLAKPYTAQQLLETIRAALNTPPGGGVDEG